LAVKKYIEEPHRPLQINEENEKVVSVLGGGEIYSVSHQYLKKFSYGFWDNQWFGRNQIYLKLKLGAKVGVLRDSHNLFSTPYRIFE
jgi:hypothetical protein